MLPIKKTLGDAARLLHVPKAGNAANFYPKSLGMQLNIWNGMFQKLETLSISFKKSLGMQLNLCNRMFHKGEMLSISSKSFGVAARLLQSYVPKGGMLSIF